jgi:hypothetical protein
MEPNRFAEISSVEIEATLQVQGIKSNFDDLRAAKYQVN